MVLRNVFKKILPFFIVIPFIMYYSTNLIQQGKRGEVKVKGFKWRYRIFTYEGSIEELKVIPVTLKGEDYIAFFKNDKFYMAFGSDRPVLVELSFEGETGEEGLELISKEFKLSGDDSILTLLTEEIVVRDKGGRIEFEKR